MSRRRRWSEWPISSSISESRLASASPLARSLGETVADQTFELPRKLPISIARCDGTAWYRLGSHEQLLSPSGRHSRFGQFSRDAAKPPALTRLQGTTAAVDP